MAICPSCGQENPDGFRLCGMCGASLAAQAALGGEERKVVTILFCDLVGFTAQSDNADPEEVRATLRPYHARARQEIERLGGTVEKFIGDAVMAVFGAPVAHEDDAERSVRSALRILQAIPQLNESHPGLDLAVRIGINTGEAVVTLGALPEKGESIVAGDVVNVAARLQQAAPIGGVVVGEMTYRATKHIVEYERLDPVSVKGKAGLVGIWRAQTARGRSSQDLEAPVAPFIGRTHELALLRETYARTASESFVQLVTVTGEPGVGKTRLISELRTFLDELPDLVIWRQGRCLPYGEGITFWALGEIVKAQAGIMESDPPEQAAGKLDASLEGLVAEPSDRDWVKTRLAPLVGARAPEPAGSVERSEYFTAWRRFLEGLASFHPVVLVFEDLHWADQPMLEFVENLVDWATGVPLLVVCSTRPELYEQSPGWGGGKRNSTTISLGPLSIEETSRLISAMLFQAVLPAETQAALLERAGGNPLYAEEFVRMLTDRGILQRRGRTVHIADGVDIPVPETVQALIAARLDSLPPERKALLHDAAVVGKVFWAGAVAFMGGTDPEAAEEGLHELARKELVRPARTSSVKEQSEYSFWHVLVRDVAYGMIPRAARAAKHRAAAEWTERIAGERVADVAELLAHHRVRALELARASGATDTTELEQAARRFLVLAGDRAMQLDVGKAESYYRQAFELLPPGHADGATVLAKAAESAWLSGRFAEAERDYEEAIGALRAQGNPLAAADAMVSLALVHGFRGKTAQSRKLMQEIVEMLERERPGPELAHAYSQIGRDQWLSGHTKEALEWSSKALSLAEQLGIREVAVMSRQVRGGARCELGDVGGLDDLRQALQLSLEYGLGHETVRGHINLGDWIWWTDGPAKGLEVMRDGIDFGERRGITGPVMWTKGETLWMLFDLGEWDDLLRVADELIAWDRRHGGSYFGVMALSYRAQVLALRGQVEEAKQLEDEFLPRAREIGDSQVLFPALSIGAQIDLALGDSAAAIELVQEFDHRTRSRPDYRAMEMHLATRVCAGAGAVELGRRMLTGARAVAARHRCCLLASEAIVTEAEGRLEQALEQYDKAAERWKEFGHVLERGQAQLGAGRCLFGLKRPVQATEQLRDARKVFLGLHAEPLVAEADSLLEEVTALTS